MDRLEAIHLFKRVVESGSFSATAREAGVTQSAVSKQIAALETYLGSQLLRRTSRSMTITDAGQVFYESRCACWANSRKRARFSSMGRRHRRAIRVTAAPVFAPPAHRPKLPAFFARYPEISIELSGSERTLNLIDEGIDLALRVGDLADSVAGRKTDCNGLDRSPWRRPPTLKAHGTPQTPDELAQHACVIFILRQEPRRWEYKAKSRLIIHQPKGCFRTADGEQIRAACLETWGWPRYHNGCLPQKSSLERFSSFCGAMSPIRS